MIEPRADGRPLVPSIVHYGAQGVEVGYDAVHAQTSDPQNTLVSVKRYMGRGLADLADDRRFPYRFVDGQAIRALQVDAAQRTQLATGALVIARSGEGYALIPRAAAEKVAARDAGMIVLDHAASVPSSGNADDDAYYARFEVPDDLVW